MEVSANSAKQTVIRRKKNLPFPVFYFVFFTRFTFHFVHASSVAIHHSLPLLVCLQSVSQVLKRSTVQNNRHSGANHKMQKVVFGPRVVPRRLAALHLVIRVRAMSWNCIPLKVFRVFFKVP